MLYFVFIVWKHHFMHVFIDVILFLIQVSDWFIVHVCTYKLYLSRDKCVCVCVGELTLCRNPSSTQLHWPQTLCLQGSPLLFLCNKYRSWPRAPWQQAWVMTYLLFNGGIYHTTTTINEKKAHSQTVEEPGGRGYFLLLTLSGLCLLLSPDKLLHDLPRDSQAGSSEDIYSYWLLEKKTHTLD